MPTHAQTDLGRAAGGRATAPGAVPVRGPAQDRLHHQLHLAQHAPDERPRGGAAAGPRASGRRAFPSAARAARRGGPSGASEFRVGYRAPACRWLARAGRLDDAHLHPAHEVGNRTPRAFDGRCRVGLALVPTRQDGRFGCSVAMTTSRWTRRCAPGSAVRAETERSPAATPPSAPPPTPDSRSGWTFAAPGSIIQRCRAGEPRSDSGRTG